jgi:phage tail sheath protein FI
MSKELLSSKVILVEEDPAVRGIPSAATAVAGAIGVTERGFIDKAVLCNSFEEVVQKFGGFVQNSDLMLAAMGFFENGGSALWVVRTVHHTDLNDPSTTTALRARGELLVSGVPTPAEIISTKAEPFAFSDGNFFSLSVNGAPEVGATLSASAASFMSSMTEPFALSDGMTLSVAIDAREPQLVTFPADHFADISAATAAEVAAVINSQLIGASAHSDTGQVVIKSDVMGMSSRVQVMGGTAAPVLSFPEGPEMGSGFVQNIKAVTVAEVLTLLAPFSAPPSAQAVARGEPEIAMRVLVINTPLVQAFDAGNGRLGLRTVAVGSSASLAIGATTADVFGVDHDVHYGSDGGTAVVAVVEGKDPGSYANQVQVEVRPRTLGEPDLFDVAVIEDGVYRELFPSVSMSPAHPRYLEKALNDAKSGSSLVRVFDQHLLGAPAPSAQIAALTGGEDGLDGLDDNDFIGSEVGKTGLRALDQVQDLSLLLVPGRATPAMHNAMVSYCEVVRDGSVFAILDPPEGFSATEIVEYVTSMAALEELTEHAAIYWPRVTVLNPAKSVFGSSEKIAVPPSGIVAGVFSRTDAGRPGGVYDPPAGIDKGRMFGVLGFETDEVLEEAKRDIVYPHRINPLTTGPGLPRFIDGSRTLKGGGNFPYVAERRGVSFIERSLKTGLQFARHRNNNEALRAEVRRTVTAFLLTQMNNGAFRSREPKKAFFVDVSETLNTPSVVFSGKLIVRIGLATNKPAEFIILRFSQDVRVFESELALVGL